MNTENRKFKALKILLAEDNKANQMVINAMLEKAGHTVFLAKTGIEVVKLIQQQNVNLILMDVQMPEMGGLEATTIIRTELNSLIPIVALTAHATEQDKIACYAAGMNDFITKPINKKMLLDKISLLNQS